MLLAAAFSFFILLLKLVGVNLALVALSYGGGVDLREGIRFSFDHTPKLEAPTISWNFLYFLGGRQGRAA